MSIEYVPFSADLIDEAAILLTLSTEPQNSLSSPQPSPFTKSSSPFLRTFAFARQRSHSVLIGELPSQSRHLKQYPKRPYSIARLIDPHCRHRGGNNAPSGLPRGGRFWQEDRRGGGVGFFEDYNACLAAKCDPSVSTPPSETSNDYP